jgi:hypothetical protein
MGEVIFRPVGPFAKINHTHAPAGDDKEIQFNDDGVWGADPKLTFDKTTGELDVSGVILTSKSVEIQASIAPASPPDGSVSVFVEETGITPNKTTLWKCKLANGDEVILSSLIS